MRSCGPILFNVLLCSVACSCGSSILFEAHYEEKGKCFDVGAVKVWWKHEGDSLDEDLKPYRDDGNASELVVFVFGNNFEVEIYTEPKALTEKANFMDKVREKMKGKKCDEEVVNSSESSDESAKSVYFDDNGEKRMNESVDGFDLGMNGCQPGAILIGLYGRRLKNRYGGILLIIVGRDSIDMYLPFSFEIVENETKDSWSWFMKLLLEDIGETRWFFTSNQQKISLSLISYGV
ncbi:hypothetical protein KIW84_075696 [Lathyrus oleraceus]|uniref:Uncharacterized protein n=1 Tax=Pisum sativum TaxID=3888 RepID=A0A9D4VUN2_PEA|nr:hypothetical protein KIW84_075696 [Pisum sativum]